ncbi:hypothetical protein HispidOSU_000770, partial [Sigmodon hispidus]
LVEVQCIPQGVKSPAFPAYELGLSKKPVLMHFSQVGKNYEERVPVAKARLVLDAKATVPLTLVGSMKTQPEPRPHMERQVEAFGDQGGRE